MNSLTNTDNAGQVLVANRGSGDISILDASNGQLIKNVALPAGADGKKAEPMYIQQILSTNEVAVDDRANNRVVFFNKDTYEVTGTVATGAGNFHMWLDPQEKQLWVVNDIDDTLTVINPQTKQATGKVTLPPELIGTDGKPHDVIVDPASNFAYVSILRENNPTADLLVKIDAKTLQVVASTEVGKDPHLSLSPESNLLYVPAQGSNKIDVFDRSGTGLVKVKTIDQPGAHGIEVDGTGKYSYTTNISGGGAKGLFAIDNRTNQLVGNTNGVDTPFANPHNIALTGDGQKLFISHSGPTADQVSFYSLADPAQPVLEGSVNDGGKNPFGIAYIAPATDNLITATNGEARGKKGNDRIFGSDDNDRLRGGNGRDKIFGGEGKDTISGGKDNDVLIGGGGSDLLRGDGGDDLLIGVNVESTNPGNGECDILFGGKGKDTFVLGDASRAYYLGGGKKDFALIKDFSTNDSDVIRLNGSANNYQLKALGAGTSIFRKSADGAEDLIGTVKGSIGLDLNNSSIFEFTTI
jgi:DNA-binding beta-propeller fold protein YncE